MASNSSHCESCSDEGISTVAIRFCSDCEESLCKECVEYHKKCKATKSHHLIDLASIAKSKIPTVKKSCEVHEDVSLDFYCTQHDTLCCRVCIPSKHQLCKDVLPLEVASKHIKKSSLFEDTFSEWQNISKTLEHLRKDRNDIIKELKKSESAICEEEREQELEFLKEHGSNNQLYLTLREQEKGVQNVVKRVQEMTRSYKRVYLKLDKSAEIDLQSIGSISEVKEKEITEQLHIADSLRITDLAVTADDTLFLCNFKYGVRKIYVYKTDSQDLTHKSTLNLPSEPYGISILSGINKLVVTLPFESYVQFINTKSLTLDKTIPLGKNCYGITTTGDSIVVGRAEEINIFKQNGEIIKNISLNDQLPLYGVCSLLYNQNDDRIVYIKVGQINNIQLDGTVEYQNAVSSIDLAVDKQGHFYVIEQEINEIQRLLPDGRFSDVVLTEKDGIKDPSAIAFNESFTKFYVTNNNGLVQIYNCK
ncbi:unnamed protein product [Mytilus edulis]|uniref:B box-type domain-containing protein n=1 Tax=Mytilus edulis TaxID=6550 RepID=A0A8S3SDL5_MYTED|nr:unnamed protein product [Mytilus edulis]